MKPGQVVSEFRATDGSQVLLRVLRRSDLGALLKFANALVAEKKVNRKLGIVSFDKRMTKKEERKFLNTVIDGVAKKQIVSLAAFVDGKLVGHCDLRRRRLKDVSHTGVLGVVILDGYRGIGVGERLIAEVLHEAAQNGIWLVELTVFAMNEAAIHLYEKIGFRRVGLVPNKMLRDGRHLDEIAMYADLRNR